MVPPWLEFLGMRAVATLMLCWLVEVPHGSARLRALPAEGGQLRRVRCVLPRTELLLRELRQAGLEEPARTASAFTAADHVWNQGAWIVGLASLGPGAQWSGELCRWGYEADILREYLCNAEDTFSVKIKACWPLQEKRRVSRRHTADGRLGHEQDGYCSRIPQHDFWYPGFMHDDGCQEPVTRVAQVAGSRSHPECIL